MVKGLPHHYIFQLLPCCEEECIHPVCKRGKPEKEHVWYDGGPPLSYLPIPIADPKRCWGQPCDECKGFSASYYLSQMITWSLFQNMEQISVYSLRQMIKWKQQQSLNARKMKSGQRQNTTIYARQFSCLLQMFVFGQNTLASRQKGGRRVLKKQPRPELERERTVIKVRLLLKS